MKPEVAAQQALLGAAGIAKARSVAIQKEQIPSAADVRELIARVFPEVNSVRAMVLSVALSEFVQGMISTEMQMLADALEALASKEDPAAECLAMSRHAQELAERMT